MHQFNDTKTPAMLASAFNAVSNYYFKIEESELYDETCHWLVVGAPGHVPSPIAALRTVDEISFIPAMFDEDEQTVHERFGLHPETKLALFIENEDTSWVEVLRCPREEAVEWTEEVEGQTEGEGGGD